MKSLSKTFILIVLVLILAQSFFLVIQTYGSIDSYKKNYVLLSGTGKAAGVVSFCINSVPILNLSDCNSSVTQDDYYTCWVFATDPDNDTLTFSSLFLEAYRAFNDSTAALFSISPEGYVNFTPTNNDVGNFTILFRVDDEKGCSNSQSSENFSLQVINVNDPPYLVTPIPNQSISEGQVVYAFYLDSYFADPDLDNLEYSVLTISSGFSVTIDNVTSRVTISSGTCDVSTLALFIAEDPYNETATSNWVRIECNSGQQPSGGGTGSGGGGGGGSLIPCKSEYECFDYYKCNRSNQKVQRCIDIKGCKEPVFLTVPCKYEENVVCNESWNCSGWGPCLPNGTQIRTCFDMNNCNTTIHMPNLTQKCEYIGTCNDGIKNCHNGSCEEGIDCGGSCGPCRSIEVPYPFEEEKSIIIYIVTGIILLLLTAVLLYHYFRKEINAALAKAGWIISRRKKKQILLSNEDKKKLLAGMLELEQKLDRAELFESLSRYSELIRHYFISVCGSGLAPEFDLEDLKKILNTKRLKIKIREILRRIFLSLFAKYTLVEQNKTLITKRNIILLVEELRNLVLQTSKVEPEDMAREIKEIEVPAKIGSLEKAVIMITNTYIALEYVELEIAKKKYLELLAEYEKLKVKEQEAVFEDISRLYHSISYVNSWLEKPKEV